jgi:hypothetical protein
MDITKIADQDVIRIMGEDSIKSIVQDFPNATFKFQVATDRKLTKLAGYPVLTGQILVIFKFEGQGIEQIRFSDFTTPDYMRQEMWRLWNVPKGGLEEQYSNTSREHNYQRNQELEKVTEQVITDVDRDRYWKHPVYNI